MNKTAVKIFDILLANRIYCDNGVAFCLKKSD